MQIKLCEEDRLEFIAANQNGQRRNRYQPIQAKLEGDLETEVEGYEVEEEVVGVAKLRPRKATEDLQAIQDQLTCMICILTVLKFMGVPLVSSYVGI